MENDFGIKVGMPCTFACWTDRYPGVVTRVTKRLIFIKQVEHGPNLREWPDQEYEVYLDRPRGEEIRVHKTKTGFRSADYSVVFGHARAYTDPCF